MKKKRKSPGLYNWKTCECGYLLYMDKCINPDCEKFGHQAPKMVAREVSGVNVHEVHPIKLSTNDYESNLGFKRVLVGSVELKLSTCGKRRIQPTCNICVNKLQEGEKIISVVKFVKQSKEYHYDCFVRLLEIAKALGEKGVHYE